MPKDTNPRGDVFGGWIMSQMDLAAGEVAGIRAKGKVATVAVSEIQFLRPVLVGDTVSCYAEVTKVGNTSITTSIEVYAERRDGTKHKVTEGIFIFVAIDDNKKPRSVDPK